MATLFLSHVNLGKHLKTSLKQMLKLLITTIAGGKTDSF